MKKLLIATTALCMTAGIASAEAALSGDARMGVAYNGSKWDFTSRVRAKFTFSGESDSGLKFGASMRADHVDTIAAGGASANNGGKGSVWISGAFGKLSMGDVDSAAEAAVGQVSGVGLTGLSSGNSITYIGAGANGSDPVALYQYTNAGLGVHLSMADGNPQKSWGVAVSYSMDAYNAAIGYETMGSTNKSWYLGVGAKMGAAAVKLVHHQNDNAGVKSNQTAISVDYTAGAATVTAYYAKLGAGSANENYGLGASYDLGGGASVVGGVARVGGKDLADLGVKFSF